MSRFPKLLTGLFREFRNSYNQGVDKIDEELDLQKQRVDDLIKGTPQPSEIVDARGGHPVLRDRLNQVDADLAHITKETVYVESYPRLGGEVDDTQRIQRAINSVNNQGGEVIFANRKYIISSTIQITKNNIRLKGKGGYSEPKISCVTPDVIMFKVDGYGVFFNNLLISGDGGANGVGATTIGISHGDGIYGDYDVLDLKGCGLSYHKTSVIHRGRNLWVSDSMITNSQTGFDILGSTDGNGNRDISFHRVKFQGIGGANLGTERVGINIPSSTNVYNLQVSDCNFNEGDTFVKGTVMSAIISDNIIGPTYHNALNLTQTANGNGRNTVISDNVIWGLRSNDQGTGILFSGSNAQIISNSIHGKGKHGIQVIGGGRLLIASNHCMNNGRLQTNTYDGINVDSVVTNSTLENNYCSDNQAEKTQRYGIKNDSSTTKLSSCYGDGNATNNLVSNNVVYRNGDVEQEQIKTATFQNGFLIASGNDEKTGYWKDSHNVVHLTGRVYHPEGSQASGTVIFTLPEGYRPTGKIHLVAATNAGTGNVEISTTGEVKYLTGSLTWFSLSGLTFKV